MITSTFVADVADEAVTGSLDSARDSRTAARMRWPGAITTMAARQTRETTRDRRSQSLGWACTLRARTTATPSARINEDKREIWLYGNSSPNTPIVANAAAENASAHVRCRVTDSAASTTAAGAMTKE